MSKNVTEDNGLGRRRFLLGAGAVGAGAVLAGCTSNKKKEDDGVWHF